MRKLLRYGDFEIHQHLAVFVLLFIEFCYGSPLVQSQPRHVHLALGETLNSLSVTWSTIDFTEVSDFNTDFYVLVRLHNSKSKVFKLCVKCPRI